jgi:hypothetical protein
LQIYEREQEYINAQNKVKQYDRALLLIRKNNEKCKISIDEMEKLGDHRTYRPVGRAYPSLKPLLYRFPSSVFVCLFLDM